MDRENQAGAKPMRVFWGCAIGLAVGFASPALAHLPSDCMGHWLAAIDQQAVEAHAALALLESFENQSGAEMNGDAFADFMDALADSRDAERLLFICIYEGDTP